MDKKEKIRQSLVAPSQNAKGYTRWWWYGAAVTKQHIEFELDRMQEAGIGGVELQIMYAATHDDEEKDIKNLLYFSPEFFDMIQFAAEQCKKRNMVFDMTPGSTWPYGGPFVELSDAMECAMPYQIDVSGPCTYSIDLTTYVTGDIVGVCMGKMVHSVMQADTVKDITDQVTSKHLFGWPWGHELKNIDIPDGDWKIVIFVVHRHRKLVGKPSGNAEGYVIDHCSRRAMDMFLENMVQPLTDRVGKGNIQGYFCDSIEVAGHNWSSVLQKEFKKRRGYALEPYLYALWGAVGSADGDVSGNVRYDYFKTMSELTIENFFDVLTEFCHKNGAVSRIQAHGTWGDILRAYAAADIPEGETFGDHCVAEVNTIHRRLAVSAGHVYNKPIISNETFTWLKKPRFTETPEHLKLAVDAVFADGCNMIVNHGYSYSPVAAGKYGWPFFASCAINHTVPWWNHYKHVAKYIQTASDFLRKGQPKVDVLFYLPQADVWSNNLMSDLHLAMKLEEHIGRDVADYLNKQGYWFDYVNDEALERFASIKNDTLQLHHNAYRAIVLVGCTRLPVKTAEILQSFAAQGGVLICAEALPSKGCGFVDSAEKAEKIRMLMAQAATAPNVVVTKDRKQSLVESLRQKFAPDVYIEQNDAVTYVHRVDNGDHLYFFPNISSEAVETTIVLRDRTEGCVLYNLETAEEKKPLNIQYTETGCTLRLRFDPCESLAVVFSPALPPIDICADCITLYDEQTLLPSDTVLQVTELGVNMPLERPMMWQTVPSLRHFSGTGYYHCTFTADTPFEDVVLELGSLQCCATVTVNGIDCGDIWKRPYTKNITTAFREGVNKIIVGVSNSQMNEILGDGYDFEQVPTTLDDWPYFGKIINDNRKTRMGFMPERKTQKEVIDSGVDGICVRIRNKKQIS